jgi:hypothetical protein
LESVRLANEAMQRFIVYRCPIAGMKVQASFLSKESKTDDRSQVYENANCPACGGVHFVNLETGKLLGDKEDRAK